MNSKKNPKELKEILKEFDKKFFDKGYCTSEYLADGSIQSFIRQTYHQAYEKGFNDGHAKERWLKEEVEKDERKKIIGVIEKMIPQRKVEYRIHHTFNNEIRDIFFDFLAKLRDV